MKAYIKFDLPEEQEEYETFNNALNYFCVLWDLDQWLRSEIKYCDKNEYQPVRDKLTELMNDRNIGF